MAKLRSINTAIWSDVWFEGLDASQKLLFIYLITNSHNNLIGVYEVSIRKIAFETGLNIETVKKGLEGFGRVGKVLYKDGFIILINFIRHQSYNNNMRKSAVRLFNELPAYIKPNDLQLVDDEEYKKGFQRVLNALQTVRKEEEEVEEEVEVEREEEVEDETKKDIKEKYTYNSFYDSELKESENDENYETFIRFIFGNNELGEPLKNVLKLKQVTYEQFKGLWNKKLENNISLSQYLVQMENYKPLTKNNQYVSRTLHNWINRDLKK